MDSCHALTVIMGEGLVKESRSQWVQVLIAAEVVLDRHLRVGVAEELGRRFTDACSFPGRPPNGSGGQTASDLDLFSSRGRT